MADCIGDTLTGSGLAVDVLPMRAVHDLTPYQAVVAGSAIQNKAWLLEAVQFVMDHQADLSRRQFAAFLVCMTLAMRNGEAYRPFAADFIAPVWTLVRPVSEGLFTGGITIRKVPRLKDRLMFRLSVMTGVWTEGDHRDWNAIRNWALALAATLGAA